MSADSLNCQQLNILVSLSIMSPLRIFHLWLPQLPTLTQLASRKQYFSSRHLKFLAKIMQQTRSYPFTEICISLASEDIQGVTLLL